MPSSSILDYIALMVLSKQNKLQSIFPILLLLTHRLALCQYFIQTFHPQRERQHSKTRYGQYFFMLEIDGLNLLNWTVRGSNDIIFHTCIYQLCKSVQSASAKITLLPYTAFTSGFTNSTT